MWKVLIKRSFRDLGKNIPRYLALGILITFSIFMVFGMIGAANTVIEQSKIKEEEAVMEDGEFSVFVPLGEAATSGLTDRGIGIEPIFSVEYKGNDGDILRMFKVREEIDLILLCDGAFPEEDTEAVLERRYAEANHLNVGDHLTVGGKEYRISGIGTVPDYNSVLRKTSDSVVESDKFGLIFVKDTAYMAAKASGTGLSSEEYFYAYRLNGVCSDAELKALLEENTYDVNDVDDPCFRDYWDRLTGDKQDLQKGLQDLKAGADLLKDIAPAYSEGVSRFTEDADKLIDEFMETDTKNLIVFMPSGENPRIGAAADDVQVNRSAGIVAGILLVILFSYVISVFIVHSIDNDSAVIGALYSLGLKSRTLTLSYVCLPVIVTFISGVLGSLIGVFTPLGIDSEMQDVMNYYSCPDMEVVIPSYLWFYGMILPPLVAAVVNVLVIRSRLKRTPLSLLRNEQKKPKGKNIRFRTENFIRKFRIRQMLRELRTGLTVVFGLFLSLLVAMLGIYIYSYCVGFREKTEETTHFEYMYTYKYETEDPPEGGYEAVAEEMKKEYGQYCFDISLMGIRQDDPFFGIDELPREKNEVVAGSSFADKYGLDVGDIFTIEGKSDGKLYAFRIADITDYRAGMMIFMDIDQVRELFGERDGYYNVVFSDHALDIETGRLYSTLTREDILAGTKVFYDHMKGLIYVLIIASAVIFVTVMYLMMKTMIDRSSFNIALVRIFGYRNREVKRMYLDGNFWIVLGGALISVPVCKLILDFIYPRFMVANVGMGLKIGFAWQIYLILFGVIIGLYLVINHLLIGRIKKAVPAEVLKNRE